MSSRRSASRSRRSFTNNDQSPIRIKIPTSRRGQRSIEETQPINSTKETKEEVSPSTIPHTITRRRRPVEIKKLITTSPVNIEQETINTVTPIVRRNRRNQEQVTSNIQESNNSVTSTRRSQEQVTSNIQENNNPITPIGRTGRNQEQITTNFIQEPTPIRRRALISPTRQEAITSPSRQDKGVLVSLNKQNKEEVLPLNPNRRRIKPIEIKEKEESKKITSIIILQDVIIRKIAEFLNIKDIMKFKRTNKDINSYLSLYPLDLSDREMELNFFLQNFSGKSVKIIGLSLVVEYQPNRTVLPNTLIPFLSNLRKLTLKPEFSQGAKDVIDLSILSNCKELVELDLFGNYVNINSLNNSIFLNKLNIGNMSNIDEDDVKLSLLSLSNLTYLRFDTIFGVGDSDSILKILPNFPRLQDLELIQCNYNEVIPLRKCTSLRSIKLLGCEYDLEMFDECSFITKFISESCLFENSEYLSTCTNLEELSLNRNKFQDSPVTTEFSKDFFTPMKRLRKLKLGNVKLDKKFTFEKMYSLKELELAIDSIAPIPPLPEIEKINAYGEESGLEILDIDNFYYSEEEIRNSEKLKKLKIRVINTGEIHTLSLDFISTCTELVELEIIDHKYDDYSCLLSLTKLEKLILEDCNVRDLSYLENCENLRDFKSTESNISDIVPLTSLTKLERLDLGKNNITKIIGLLECTNLTYLSLYENPINSLIGLDNLTKLTYLDLGYTKADSYSLVGGCINLEKLSLKHTSIKNLRVLTPLKKLIKLDLGSCVKIKDLKPLVECVSLSFLKLNNIVNPSNLLDISPLKKCLNLRRLDLKNSKISGDYDKNLKLGDFASNLNLLILPNGTRLSN